MTSRAVPRKPPSAPGRPRGATSAAREGQDGGAPPTLPPIVSPALRAPPRPLFEPGTAFELPLWEARSRAYLLGLQRDQPRMFRRGMQQQPLDDGERLFARGLPKLLRYGTPGDPLHARDLASDRAPRYGGFDPAGETRPGNALVSAALSDRSAARDVAEDAQPATEGRGATPAPTRVIVGCALWANEVVEPGTSPYLYTARRLADAHARHRYRSLMVESNATQGAISALTLTVDPSIPFDHVVTGSGKRSEETGLPGLATEMERGLWALCVDDPYDTGRPLRDHDSLCPCAYCMLVGDLAAYPDPARGKYDALMSLLFAWTAIRRHPSDSGLQIYGSAAKVPNAAEFEFLNRW